MPIDASTNPYDPSGLDPASSKLGDLPDIGDDDIDLDDAGFGASGRAGAVLADDDDAAGGAGSGKASVDLGTDDDIDEVDAGAKAPGFEFDEADVTDVHDAPGELGDLDLSGSKVGVDDDDDDLDGAGTGSKSGVADDDVDLDGPSGRFGDVDLDGAGKGGVADGLDGVDDEPGFKIDVGAADLDDLDDVDSDLGGRVGAGVGLDDEPDDFGKFGDDADDPDDPSDVDKGAFDHDGLFG